MKLSCTLISPVVYVHLHGKNCRLRNTLLKLFQRDNFKTVKLEIKVGSLLQKATFSHMIQRNGRLRPPTKAASRKVLGSLPN